MMITPRIEMTDEKRRYDELFAIRSELLALTERLHLIATEMMVNEVDKQMTEANGGVPLRY